MNKQEFLTAVRRDGEQFRADKIVVATGQDELIGNGTVRVMNGAFQIEVTLDGVTKAPSLPTGFHGSSGFWKVDGVIGDEIHFHVRCLPCGSIEHWGDEKLAKLVFNTNNMELEPSSFDQMTYQEIAERLNGHGSTGPSQNSNTQHEDDVAPRDVPAEKKPQDMRTDIHNVEVSFVAVLRDFKLIARNGGTDIVEKNDFLGEQTRSSRDTFQGEVQEWKFGLIQKDDDLHVHLRSKPDRHSKGEVRDEHQFKAFLDSLAFSHGQHAWPFSVEHRRDGRLAKDRVQLHKTVARTPHAPFSERLALTAMVGKVAWDFQTTLQTVYAFFCTNSKLSRETTQLLYLYREAGSPIVPYRTRLLILSSLLESLVQAVYAEKIKPQKSTETASFDAAKQQVCDWLKQTLPQQMDPGGFQRILRILTNAEATNIRVKFDSVIDHLGLKPEDEWQQLFELWAACRNPLSHRIADNDESEQSVKEDMAAVSNIAGAINCIILRLMGYSGYVQRSALEDKYMVI